MASTRRHDNRASAASRPRDVAPTIQIDSVSKTFQRSKGDVVTALDDISMRVSGGEVVSLLGPSGCGKSTLLMIVAGLLSQTGGTATIGGSPVRGPSADVGVVFQRDLLFDWRTVLDNVLLPFVMRGEKTRPHKPKARELLQQVGLDGFDKRRPHELSGGMRQRVALCRTLIQDPRILLLDEPFAALDALTREQMQLDLQRMWVGQSRSAILVTHDIAEAVFLSDRVLVMTPRPGRIHESIEIDLPRPRVSEVRESAAFGDHVAHIHGLFKRLGVLHG